MRFLGVKLEIFIFFLLKETLLIGRKAAYIRGISIGEGGYSDYQGHLTTFGGDY